MNNNISPEDIWGEDSVEEPPNTIDTTPPAEPHTNSEEPCGSLSCFQCTPNPYLEDLAWLSVTSDMIQAQIVSLAPLADLNAEDAIETGVSLILGLITQYPVFGELDAYAYAWELARTLHHWADGVVPDIEIPNENDLDSLGSLDNYTIEAATWLDCTYNGNFEMAENVLHAIAKTIVQEYPEHQEEYYDQETLEEKDPAELAQGAARMGVVTFLSLILTSTSTEVWDNTVKEN